MNKCNLFKQLSSPTGEFLMFSQYTDDITREQSNKSTYRVVPSKFIALELNLSDVFQNTAHNTTPYIVNNGGVYELQMGDPSNPEIISGVDEIIPQILQSFYENSVSHVRDLMDDPANTIQFNGPDANGRTIEWSTELLWYCLEKFKFVNKITYTPDPDDSTAPFQYYDEVKYIGDINIHSNRNLDTYNYDEIFCHIPTDADEYYYHIFNFTRKINGTLFTTIPFPVTTNSYINGWDPSTYPNPYPLSIYNITSIESNNTEGYCVGYSMPELSFDTPGITPVPRGSSEYNINAILVLYDIYYSEPGNYPVLLHQGRPMGLWLSGNSKTDSTGADTLELCNTVVKYVTNNDAYGQGSSFGLRIMSRYTPTPNNTTPSIEVSTESGDYESITAAMGTIADAIVDLSNSYAGLNTISQLQKEHLSIFRNTRTNVPYTRVVDGRQYWFINGRNTGMPVIPGILHTSIIPSGTGSISIHGTNTSYINTNDGGVAGVLDDTIDITAIPAQYYIFKQWWDGDTNPIKANVGVGTTTNISAEFRHPILIIEPTDPIIGDVIVTQNGTSTTISTPFNIDSDGSIDINIEFVPASGVTFDGWSDGDTMNPRHIIDNISTPGHIVLMDDVTIAVITT